MSNPFATSSPPPVFGQPGSYDQHGPPEGGAWQPSHTVPLDDEEDEPFTAAHLAAANEAAVPAVPAVGAPPPAAPAMAFTESTAAPPTQPLGGRIGQPAALPVPRVGSAPDTRLLGGAAGATGPSAPLGNGSRGQLASAPPEDPSKYAFYNVKRYRVLFNVDTADVLWRMFHAVLLFFKGDFLEYVGGNPDLYGPFWVASTLIFVTAATGNLASYISWQRDAPEGESHDAWFYDVDKVGGSFALFYGYVGLVGLALYLVLRWFKAGVPLASVWCVYGYALAIFIPISCVCVLPMELVRWVLVGMATLTSGTFIMLSLRSAIHEAAGAKAVPLYLGMIALHCGLGFALKFYFFSY